MRERPRYGVVKMTDLDGNGNSVDTFRIRDLASTDLLEVVFSSEESARDFVEKINAAPSLGI